MVYVPAKAIYCRTAVDMFVRGGEISVAGKRKMMTSGVVIVGQIMVAARLNPTCHLVALLAHHILHVSWKRVIDTITFN